MLTGKQPYTADTAMQLVMQQISAPVPSLMAVSPNAAPALDQVLRKALAKDPAGTFFGLWQPTGHRGFEVFGEAGAPVYHQLTIRDYTTALDFYRTLFDWQLETVSDTDEFRYSTANFNGEALVGIMDGGTCMPDGVPSSWDFFLGSDDVDKTVALITDNGGSVIRGAEDTPYGRLAAVADPTGARFHLSSVC